MFQRIIHYKYNNIKIYIDSTFIKTEYLDILAKVSKNCSKKCEKKFAEITKMGMNGSISFKDSLEKRIKLLRATKKDIEDTIKIIKTHVSSSFVKNKYFIKKNANCMSIGIADSEVNYSAVPSTIS